MPVFDLAQRLQPAPFDPKIKRDDVWMMLFNEGDGIVCRFPFKNDIVTTSASKNCRQAFPEEDVVVHNPNSNFFCYIRHPEH